MQKLGIAASVQPAFGNENVVSDPVLIFPKHGRKDGNRVLRRKRGLGSEKRSTKQTLSLLLNSIHG